MSLYKYCREKNLSGVEKTLREKSVTKPDLEICIRAVLTPFLFDDVVLKIFEKLLIENSRMTREDEDLFEDYLAINTRLTFLDSILVLKLLEKYGYDPYYYRDLFVLSVIDRNMNIAKYLYMKGFNMSDYVNIGVPMKTRIELFECRYEVCVNKIRKKEAKSALLELGMIPDCVNIVLSYM